MCDNSRWKGCGEADTPASVLAGDQTAQPTAIALKLRCRRYVASTQQPGNLVSGCPSTDTPAHVKNEAKQGRSLRKAGNHPRPATGNWAARTGHVLGTLRTALQGMTMASRDWQGAVPRIWENFKNQDAEWHIYSILPFAILCVVGV